jgi:hypothetical protein
MIGGSEDSQPYVNFAGKTVIVARRTVILWANIILDLGWSHNVVAKPIYLQNAKNVSTG